MAVMTFDFQKSEVRSFVPGKPTQINGRYFFESSDGDINVVLTEVTLFTFGRVQPGPMGCEPTIEGTAQEGARFESDSVFNVHIICHPQP
jgi:hypothetical protein